MQPPQGGTRFETQLVVESEAPFGEDLECLRLTAAAVEREHQGSAQALPVRVSAHKRAQLRGQRRVAAERQVRLHAQLDGVEPSPIQTLGSDAVQRLTLEVGEGAAAPEGEGGSQVA